MYFYSNDFPVVHDVKGLNSRRLQSSHAQKQRPDSETENGGVGHLASKTVEGVEEEGRQQSVVGDGSAFAACGSRGLVGGQSVPQRHQQ